MISAIRVDALPYGVDADAQPLSFFVAGAE
jgi:hypothetical protein